ncbi:MAG: SulP family inorganic anion transporter [Bacteroidales bacterium]|nr:SulP family inorganic anion transporter [Bacteroidales bacterium]MCK9449679.1 SulP family inorganic anion transporter [Bacteroidales bacterium]MDD3702293.1 SulP family inorganic anion transporter [Bacteroidales bacterium]
MTNFIPFKEKLLDVFHPKILTTLKQYNSKLFFSDLTAGLIVGIVALPLAIAFGIASGVSPSQGLITAVIAGFLISLLGGSLVQIGGPTGAFIVIVYGIVQQFGVDGLLTATLMAGAMLIIMGVLRLGTIIKFMPYPVVVGFTSGIAVVIFSSQIKDFFGMSIAEAVPADFIDKWHFYIINFSTINWYAIGIALFTVITIVFWPRFNRRIPGTLIALILTTIVATLFQFPTETIGSQFGAISGSIPAPSFPSVSFAHLRKLIAPAFTIAMLGAIESLLSAMVADGAIGGKHRSNTELIAQGVANLITPLFGGIPATGAIARTMTNIRNGGRTPLAGIIHAFTLLLIMLFFGQYARLIPMATLAGILVMVAYNMSEWRAFTALMRGNKADIAVLLTTFLLTVLIDLTVAIQFGLLLAVLLFVKRLIDTTGVEVLRLEVESETDELLETATSLDIPKGVEVFEVNGPFFFGVANKFEDAETQLSEKPLVRIIRLWRVPFIDATGINNLRLFLRRAQSKKIKTILSGANPTLLNSLSKNGIVAIVGKRNICADIHCALDRANEVLEQIEQEQMKKSR